MTTITISLPTQTAKQIDLAAKKRGFATRSEFMRSLLRDYLEGTEATSFEEYQNLPLEQVRLELARTGKYNEEFIESVVGGLKQSSAYES